MASMQTDSTVELCSRCRASVTLTTHASPFQGDFVRGYDNPSLNDASFISNCLSDARSELGALTGEIQRAQAALNTLKSHHAYLASYIKQTQVYSTPSIIRHLPTEVLGLIFTVACDSFQRNEYKTPLSLSLVCSKWRDIAVSDPMLWTHIYVDRNSEDIVYHYLDRCADPAIPLSVKLDLPALPYVDDEDCDEDTPVEQTHEGYLEHFLWGIYHATAPRWKEVEFHTSSEDFAYLGQGMLKALPLLESLTMAFKDKVPRGGLADVWSCTPLLRRVVMLDACKAGHSLWADKDGLPWNQLRHVETDQDDALRMDLNPAFKFNPDKDDENKRARTLTIGAPRREIGYSQLWPKVLHVTSLVLQPGAWTSGLVRFFECVAIPTLIDLTLVSPSPQAVKSVPFIHSMDWANVLGAVAEFLRTTDAPRLKGFSFIMHGVHPGDDDCMAAQPSMADTLVNALNQMPGLERLKIVEAVSGPHLLTDSLVARMILNEEDELLSGLQSLELVWGETSTPSWSALTTMITSRVGKMDRLSSVALGLRNGADLPRDIQLFMHGLRKDGVDGRLW